MSMLDELIQAAASPEAGIEEMTRKAARLRQQILNVRAQAAIAGLINMQEVLEAAKKADGESK